MPEKISPGMSEEALLGIKVIDLSQGIGGPYCTKLMAAFGAEVIKVEPPGEGDYSRSIGPFPDDVPHPEKSALFLYLNTRKKSITLNLNSEKCRAIILDLVKRSDILVENLDSHLVSRLGLTYQKLAKVNQNLIMVSISPFGRTGPYRHYRGGRLSGFAMGGQMYIAGDPAREPLAGAGEQPEYHSGLQGFDGAMVALIARDSAGRGQWIDVSCQEAMAAAHQYTIARFSYNGRIQKRTGKRMTSVYPVATYPCRDGYICITAPMDHQVENMLTVMGMKSLLDDPRFNTGGNRLGNAREFDKAIGTWFVARGKKEIMHTMQKHHVPCSSINEVQDILEDPQLKAREFWVETDHPVAGKHLYAGAPFKMSETPWHTSPAPLLGEHNQEVYCGYLGYSKEEMVRLRQCEVI